MPLHTHWNVSSKRWITASASENVKPLELSILRVGLHNIVVALKNHLVVPQNIPFAIAIPLLGYSQG
jgi:hypothetical protein